jgi:hypothetical protein
MFISIGNGSYFLTCYRKLLLQPGIGVEIANGPTP